MAGNPFINIPEFPDFPAMTPAAAEEAMPKLLADAKARVDAIESGASADWAGFVLALDDAVRPLYEAWGLVGHLLSTCNSEEWRALEAKWQPDIVAFSLRVGQSRKFHDLAAELRSKLPGDAPPARRRILDKMIQGYELSGVALDGEKKKRFNEVATSLAKLSADFRDHVLDATKAFRLPVSEAQLDGVPEQVRAMARRKDGGFEATIEDAMYVPLMKHCRDRSVRERLYRARSTRASSGTTDNAPLIDGILSLRREKAKLLGFKDPADLSLSTKCAPSAAAVFKMIDDLAAASRPAAKREKSELVAFAAEAAKRGDGNGDMAPWDVSYYAERQRESLYSYSEEELSRYFNFPVVLEGLFKLAGRLFGVSISPADWSAPVWHKDVRFFRVGDEDGRTIAHFYLDPYSRPETKQGGAWMNEFRTRNVRPDGKVELPLAVICCNQALPDAEGRCLMTFREVETLFHEFGHALQHMLTRVDDGGASGLNLVDWDAVEVASQFMENWCVDSATLSRFAFHVDTHAPLPASLLEKVRAARNYRAGTACLRQLAFAKTDMLLHSESFSGEPEDVKRSVFADYDVPMIPEDRFLNSFTHIFAGGYAAGYYGYKWSEVMSADVFGAFEEAGLSDEEAVRRVGRSYRDTFLALGGSVDPMEVFRRFRGRAPAIDALLRQQGLK